MATKGFFLLFIITKKKIEEKQSFFSNLSKIIEYHNNKVKGKNFTLFIINYISIWFTLYIHCSKR